MWYISTRVGEQAFPSTSGCQLTQIHIQVHSNLFETSILKADKGLEKYPLRNRKIKYDEKRIGLSLSNLSALLSESLIFIIVVFLPDFRRSSKIFKLQSIRIIGNLLWPNDGDVCFALRSFCNAIAESRCNMIVCACNGVR